jgi:hypothetical protein
MSQITTIVSGKEVQLSEPYAPDQNQVSDFVGRERILETITASWIWTKEKIEEVKSLRNIRIEQRIRNAEKDQEAERNSVSIMPLSPLLVGEPGVGKNRIVYELAMLKSQPLYILQGHEDVTAEDMACLVRFSDKPGERKLDYILSPLATAMITGGICFIDEIGKIRPRALALLVSVLDERRYMDSNLLGGRIWAREEFRFIAATNNADTHSIPEFINSRMRPVIYVDYQSKEEIDRIVKNMFKKNLSKTNQEHTVSILLKEKIEPLLIVFWSKWNELLAEDNFKLPAPRDIIFLFNLANGFKETRKNQFIEKEDLELAFKELFKLKA